MTRIGACRVVRVGDARSLPKLAHLPVPLSVSRRGGGVGSCVCVLCGVGTIASACHSSAGAEEGNKMGRE